jgi:transcriptional regulator with XRE-family HTH domain
MSEFGEQLKAWREAHGFSQADAAEHLNISKRTLQNWEQGKSTPNWPTQAAFGDRFRVKRKGQNKKRT